MKYADLHIHTNFSDSTFSVREVVQRAKSLGLSCISICDHDTVQALDECKRFCQLEGIDFVPGIELTCQYKNQEIHILGYFVDYNDNELCRILDSLREQRRQRIYAISQKLKSLGVALEPEEILSSVSPQAAVGRLHVAQALVKKKIVTSLKEAFLRFIGEKAPGYVARFRFSPQEGISILRRARALPVLAHPFKSHCDPIIPDLVENGLEGIEVFYPEHSPQIIEYYMHLAQKYGLLITGGSDCHGLAKKKILMGEIKLPYRYVEKLKLRHRELYG